MQRLRKDMENWIKLRLCVCACVVVVLPSSFFLSLLVFWREEKLYSKNVCREGEERHGKLD